jgi:hypothetical protein
MYGNSNRTTRSEPAERASAISCMNAESIPAPAPWARMIVGADLRLFGVSIFSGICVTAWPPGSRVGTLGQYGN